MKQIVYVLGLVLCFLSGWFLNTQTSDAVAADTAEGDAVPPAYMIISVNEIHPEKMGPYRAAVRPLIQKVGGTELLSLSKEADIQVLEGEFEFPGILLIEKFESMNALKSYWYSDAHQEAKKLRDGIVEPNFFLAIEGRPQPK
jgi:uncharacterized protein (DUF1330 family)